MEKFYTVTIWTKDEKLTSMNFEKFENAITFANQHKEELYSIKTERYMDFKIK